jgi:hypothetical protein
VVCAPADTAGPKRCQTGCENLSEIILAVGGARATPDASPELLAAEDQARSAHLGAAIQHSNLYG